MYWLIITGVGGHARSVAEAALLSGAFEFVDFIDDAFQKLAKVWDFPVLGTTADIEKNREFAEAGVVAIGNNELREVLCDQLRTAGFELVTVFLPCHCLAQRYCECGMHENGRGHHWY